MTFKEKWEQEHPGENFNIISIPCPYGCGYEDGPKNNGCNHMGMACEACWDREIPVVKTNAATAITISATIKDSGDRTEFETGAVRDMREGKGRCDLMPLEVVATLLEKIRGKQDPVLHNVAHFQNTRDTYYLYNALERFSERNGDKTDSRRYCTMLLEVAKHFEEGAKKYGENNWQKGIPVHCYIDSAIRHYLKWLRGDTDEPHDRAFVWNIMCCIWEVDYHEKKENA